MMEPTIAISPHREHVHRLPSLNNLLESEVILGDDDGSSSCDGEESEMHSALEDLSETNTADLKFHDCSMTSSITESASLAEPSLPDLNKLSLTQSYYRPSEESTVTKSMLPRSNSTLSSRTTSSTRSRLIAPRPSYAENTSSSSSKGRYTSSSPFAPRRSHSVSGPHSQPATPTTARKPPVHSPSPRPAVPPKPVGLTRQPSNLKAKTPESPIGPRRSSSILSSSSSPAAKSFLASGKQPSVIRNSKPVTPVKPSTPPKRMEERFATLGRRPKPNSPPVLSTSMSGGMTSMDMAAAARETKATADKFGTLPRRKPVKERPCLPKTISREPEPIQNMRSDGGATLPRPLKKLSSPILSSSKPRTLIYMEKSAQTELSHQDVREGQEASLKLRSLSRQHQHQNNEEARQLERMLFQSQEEARLLQQELDEEREERQLVQRELERTTQRVAAMLDSMEGVEREFTTRGDSLIHLETNLQSSTQTICAMQEQLEAQDAALIAQRLELDRSLQAEKALIQQLNESDSENREMMEFLQAEKLALQDAVRDSEAEMGSLKSQLEDSQRQLLLKEEECQHLVRLAEQRRHELAALQADLKGAEGRTGSVLLAQGAQLSAAALALVKLHSRMDGLLQMLLQTHSLPIAEMEALVFPNEAYNDESPSTHPFGSRNAIELVPTACQSEVKETPTALEPTQVIQRLVGSTSLQDLSDAINLTRRRPPEGREEPNPVIDEELRLAASLVDQIEEADHVLSKLLRVLRRLILDKDSTLQQLSDEKEQLLASLSAQTVALQEAKDELKKMREDGDKVESSSLSEKSVELGSYYVNGRWNDLSTRLDAQVCWSKTVSQVLETLPIDVLHANPALQQLLQNLTSTVDDQHDPNANGSG